MFNNAIYITLMGTDLFLAVQDRGNDNSRFSRFANDEVCKITNTAPVRPPIGKQEISGDQSSKRER